MEPISILPHSRRAVKTLRPPQPLMKGEFMKRQKFFNQTVMAGELGVKPTYLSGLKSGLTNAVSHERVTQLAKYFDTRPEIWLRGGDLGARVLAMERKRLEGLQFLYRPLTSPVAKAGAFGPSYD